ncbi:unnamed protein product, partial [Oppiella nova]
MGWADVGHHSDHILTPNIDTLAADGVVLNNFYVQPVSNPSSGALLTGRHPMHLGFQNIALLPFMATGFPLHFKLLPQYLKHYNYATHIVGKWHLGFMNREYTPTYRGFDSHVGYWTNRQFYFNHTNCDPYDRVGCGYDFRHNMDVITNASGVYSTHYFTDRCLHIIDEHNTSEPLFLYVPHQAIHVSANKLPVEAPQEYIDMFAYIESDMRRGLAAAAYSMDESIGAVVERLHSRQMLE